MESIKTADMGVTWTFGQSENTDNRTENTFYEGGSYAPKITYIGTDKVTRKDMETPVDMPRINVIRTVVYKEAPQATGGKRVALDASSLSNIGSIEWYLSDNTQKVASTDFRYSPDKIFKDEDYVCLKL